jgi:hypothetical protein
VGEHARRAEHRSGDDGPEGADEKGYSDQSMLP